MSVLPYAQCFLIWLERKMLYKTRQVRMKGKNALSQSPEKNSLFKSMNTT